MLNAVQSAAYELIQSDARFVYSLTYIQQNAENIESNYVMMCQPYIGIFADGAEQWCKKAKMEAPKFTPTEKIYYTKLRSSHKLLELPYESYMAILRDKFHKSDAYFYNLGRPWSKIVGYNNVGADLCNGEFCGNTILCASHSPIDILDAQGAGPWLRKISVVAGRLAKTFKCTEFPPFKYNDNLFVTYKDYHFFKNCPLTEKSELGFLLFSILCGVNYVIQFIDKYFVDEIPQKFKFAYLQYYYLCDFVDEINTVNTTNFHINISLKSREFRNCLAHYGLGQYMSEADLIPDDILKGLTNKAFNMDYLTTKKQLYTYLNELVQQIKLKILK